MFKRESGKRSLEEYLNAHLVYLKYIWKYFVKGLYYRHPSVKEVR